MLKKINDLSKHITIERLWSWGEVVILFAIWYWTKNLLFVLSAKLLSTYVFEVIFHEEIADSFKRIAWQLLCFIGFVVTLALNNTGFWVYGVSISLFITMMGKILFKIGSFHQNLKTV